MTVLPLLTPPNFHRAIIDHVHQLNAKGKVMNELSHERLHEELRQFTGTTRYYRFHHLFLTDGAKYLADRAECYWLLDIVWSISSKLRSHRLVICRLTVNEDMTAVFEARGDDGAVLYRQEIEYTDFPGEWVEMWFANRVMMVPTEY